VVRDKKTTLIWLNSFTNLHGVPQKMSPPTIITGQHIYFDHHCQNEFGEYVQTHEETDNSMSPRTIGALSMRPTGNDQGSYYYFSLTTGRIINRRQATQLPMPEDVIDMAHVLARQKMLKLINCSPTSIICQ
jgi:hypothetical protein